MWSTSSLSALRAQVFLEEEKKKRQQEIKFAHYPEASDLDNGGVQKKELKE